MDEITANKKSIREFAHEAFDHMLSLLSYKATEMSKESRQMYRNVLKIMSNKPKNKVHLFTENIEFAVIITNELLNHYFKPFLKLNITRNLGGTFVNDFKLILLHWLQKRDNIFVKIIDSLAIITKTFLFCICFEKFHPNIKYITDELIKLFEEIFPLEFFHKGGWSRLDEKAEMLYKNLYLEYDEVSVVGYCKFVTLLRKSTVMFPVPATWLCEKCKTPQDEIMTRQITYVIPDYECLNSLDNKSFSDICTDPEKVSQEDRIECVKNRDIVEKEKNTYVERKYSSYTGIEYIGTGKDLEKLLEREKDSVITVKYSEDIDNNSANGRIGTIHPGKIDVDNGKQSVEDGMHIAHDKMHLPFQEKYHEGDEKDKVKEAEKRRITVEDCSSSKKKSNIFGNKYSGNANNCVYIGDRGLEFQNLKVDKKYCVPLNVFLNIKKQFNNLKCESAGKEFIDNGKVSSDAGKQPIDDKVNASYDSKKDLSKDEQSNNNYSKDWSTVKEIIHSTVAADSKKPYNSDSTLEMNQNLLEVFIGNACNTGITENNDFWFIAEKYSHSVENMVKELFSFQPTNIDKLSDIIQVVKTSYNNIPNLDERLFFSSEYVFVSIGGTKNNTKRGNKN